MRERCRWQEHVGAISFDHANAILPAELDRLRAYCALSAGAIHPHLANAGLGTIAHHAFRLPGRVRVVYPNSALGIYHEAAGILATPETKVDINCATH